MNIYKAMENAPYMQEQLEVRSGNDICPVSCDGGIRIASTRGIDIVRRTEAAILVHEHNHFMEMLETLKDLDTGEDSCLRAKIAKFEKVKNSP